MLTKTMQTKPLVKQLLKEYCKKHKQELSRLSKEELSSLLTFIVFDSGDVRQHSQKQKRGLRLLIASFVESSTKPSSSKKYFLPLIFILLPLAFTLTLLVLPKQAHEEEKSLATTVLGADVEPLDQAKHYPIRLKIPKINVDAAVQYLDIIPDGTLEVPTNITEVGWFDLGPSPGEAGNAIISGHLDKTRLGVFNNLHKLAKGDAVQVVNDAGHTLTFIVSESRIYSPGHVSEVFTPSDTGIHLNLITCAGVWDNRLNGYTKRLVVFADIAS